MKSYPKPSNVDSGSTNIHHQSNGYESSTDDQPSQANVHQGQAYLRKRPTNSHPGPENVYTGPASVPPGPLHIPLGSMNLPPMPPVGPIPIRVFCPSCGVGIISKIRYEPSSKTHLIACIGCLVFLPFAWLPYCIDDCQNANHYCPNCGAYLGTYK